MRGSDEFLPIADYGLIGDLRTTALVGSNGSVDVLCWPKYDSPSIFAAHVDPEKGGRFWLKPTFEDANRKQIYLPDTNILLNRFLSEQGIAEISSFMALNRDGAGPQALVRRAKSVHGTIRFDLRLAPRFNYARTPHRVERLDENSLRFIEETEDGTGLVLEVHAEIPLEIEDGRDAIASFTLESGQHASFVLSQSGGEDDKSACCADESYAAEAFKETSNFWRRWVQRNEYGGRWREMVTRSALALKLLCSRDNGAMIAAPCFGFPNEVGGERNWDYRFTWLRDAAFTSYGLMRLGYLEEAGAFMNWLTERIDQLEPGQLPEIMYRIDGSPVGGEVHLDHLRGYRDSRPVRVGSTNHDQLQLDIFGELMDSLSLYDKFGTGISHAAWKTVTRLIDWLCANWNQPDASIWEVRSDPRHFTYSRVMCWVAIDRALRLARRRSLAGPLVQWRQTRDAIHAAVLAENWNEQRQAFTQFPGTDAMDASVLIMPLVRFLAPTDPLWLSTLQALEEDLVYDNLVYRYRVGQAFSDHLKGGEGTFSLCSFWYVEAVARSGDLKKARLLFEKMLSYANDLGLFSEQLGPKAEFLGNVPQAFTHLALISAAFDLDRRLDQKDWRE